MRQVTITPRNRLSQDSGTLSAPAPQRSMPAQSLRGSTRLRQTTGSIALVDAPVILYPFRLRDHLSGKWYRARWKASLEEIEKLGGVVDGEPETRGGGEWAAGFRPYRDSPKPLPVDSLELHPQRADPPAIDAAERFLVPAILRRYVTYCARRGQQRRAIAAAGLWREVSRPGSVRPETGI